MADSKSSPRNRRVWRISPEMPMGGFVDSAPPTTPVTVTEAEPLEASKKVLTLPRAPSWQSSSYDLLVGATASEVEDTIPGDLLDELFGDQGPQG